MVIVVAGAIVMVRLFAVVEVMIWDVANNTVIGCQGKDYSMNGQNL
jgi:hypothetical protein